MQDAPLVFPALISNIDFALPLEEHPSWRCISSSFLHLIGPKNKNKKFVSQSENNFQSTLNLFMKKYMVFTSLILKDISHVFKLVFSFSLIAYFSNSLPFFALSRL
jgi:hypothetical protein